VVFRVHSRRSAKSEKKMSSSVEHIAIEAEGDRRVQKVGIIQNRRGRIADDG